MAPGPPRERSLTAPFFVTGAKSTKRLRVVSNFGDSGEIHVHACEKRAEETCHKGRHQKLETTDKAKIRDYLQPTVAVAVSYN